MKTKQKIKERNKLNWLNDASGPKKLLANMKYELIVRLAKNQRAHSFIKAVCSLFILLLITTFGPQN